METFGQRLKSLRNERGISQNELSKHIGVSKSSVNMYERDEREPGFETLEAIADFFNVNMDYLLGRGPRITTSINSQEISITAQINEKEFSASAQPTLIKFVAGVNSSEMPDCMDYLLKVRAEMDRTFTDDDFLRLSKFLESINAAYEQALTIITQKELQPPVQATNATAATDTPEPPPEGGEEAAPLE